MPGTVTIDVPSGFSVPQVTSPSAAGYLSVSAACAQFRVTGVTANAGGEAVTIAANCTAGQKATLIYQLVTVPTTAAAYPFATSFTPTSTGAPLSFAAQHSVTIKPGALASVTLAPATASIVTGGTQTYTATGFDAYGNSTGTIAGLEPNVPTVTFQVSSLEIDGYTLTFSVYPAESDNYTTPGVENSVSFTTTDSGG